MLDNNLSMTSGGLCSFENVNGEFEYIFYNLNRIDLETVHCCILCVRSWGVTW